MALPDGFGEDTLDSTDPPFNDIGAVPVRNSSKLAETAFFKVVYGGGAEKHNRCT